METSVFIARFIAVVYVLVGLGLFLNANYFKKAFDEMYKSSAFVLIGGLMAFAVGFVIVSVHNVWVKDWTVLITIIGWSEIIRGALLLLAPEFLLKVTRPIIKNLRVIALFAVVLGLVFGYFGFVV